MLVHHQKKRERKHLKRLLILSGKRALRERGLAVAAGTFSGASVKRGFHKVIPCVGQLWLFALVFFIMYNLELIVNLMEYTPSIPEIPV